MRKILLLLPVVLFTSTLFAQDKIYKLRGDVIKAKVIEIGTDEVKYKLYDNPDGPLYVIDKAAVSKIEYANGTVEKYKLSYKDPANYEGQLTKAIKLNFLAPLLGYTQFSFEKSVAPLKSYELSLGIIGAGKNSEIDDYYINGQNQPYRRNAFGGFIEAGYKFTKLPNFYNKGLRMIHLLQGSYVKPTAIFGYYSDNALNYKTGDPVLQKRHNVFGAVVVNLGHQWIFGDKFLLDIYYGLGYAFDNSKSNYDDYYSDEIYNHFVIQKTGDGASLGFSGGIKIGLLIK